MTSAEALELLRMHVSPDLPSGFLGSLRPYTGLRDENFEEVIAAIKILAPKLQGETIDRELVSLLWSLCYFARLWGLESDGMLQRNGLISESDTVKLRGWVNKIDLGLRNIFEGVEVEGAFE
jgi:hypothetical protein